MNDENIVKAKMTFSQLMYLLAHLVHVPALFNIAKEQIHLEYFDASVSDSDWGEKPLLYIWKGLLEFHAHHMELIPLKDQLEFYIDQVISSDLVEDAEEFRSSLFNKDPQTGYLSYLYSVDIKALSAETGRILLQDFLLERGVRNEVLRQAQSMIEGGGLVPLKLSEILTNMSEQANKIRSLGVPVSEVPLFPDADYFSIPEPQMRPCGVPWLDTGLGGGQRPGSVIAVIGATGAGKTTLAAQVLIGNAREALADTYSGIAGGFTVFYSFEQSASDLIINFGSAAAQIAVESLRSHSFSTDASNIKPYEKQMWPNMNVWKSEKQRWDEARWFNNYVVIQNFSGVPDRTDVTLEQQRIKRNRGTGGIDEITADVERLIQKKGSFVRAIIIDYAGLVLYRQYGANSDDKRLYQNLAYIGDTCRKQLAGRFNCPVWLLHQLAGAANEQSPCKPMHHAYASGCKSFADNVDTCLCLGNPDMGDPEQNRGKCLYATFSKTRNVGAQGAGASRILMHQTPVRGLVDRTDDLVASIGERCFRWRGTSTWNNQ